MKTPTRTRQTPPRQSARDIVRNAQETRREKFLRLGNARMINALYAVRLIGNLASSNYSWSADDVALMQNTMIDAVNETFAKFKRPSEQPRLEDTFDLRKFTLAHQSDK